MTEKSDERKREADPSAPIRTTQPSPNIEEQPANEPQDFFQSYKMWFVYIALFCFFSFLFTDIPINVGTILGAIVLTGIVAFIDAAIKPEGPYVTPRPQKPAERFRHFVRSLVIGLIILAIVCLFLLSFKK